MSIAEQEADLVAVAELLADGTRQRILAYLANGERYVGELCGKLGLSQPATGHHLAILRAGGLIEGRREGKRIYYRLCPDGPLRELAEEIGAWLASAGRAE